MTQDIRVVAHRRAALVADLIMAAAVGLLALILLAPTSGVDSQPPECYSTFTYLVPCSWAWAYAACVVATAATATILMAFRRRRPA